MKRVKQNPIPNCRSNRKREVLKSSVKTVLMLTVIYFIDSFSASSGFHQFTGPNPIVEISPKTCINAKGFSSVPKDASLPVMKSIGKNEARRTSLELDVFLRRWQIELDRSHTKTHVIFQFDVHRIRLAFFVDVIPKPNPF